MSLILSRKGVFGLFLLLLTMVGQVRRASAASHPLRVRDGVLTVDGLPVRSNLNVALSHFHYLYVYLPHQGTAVIAERAFAGAQEQRNAFHGSTLTVDAGGSHLQLTSMGRLRGARAAYVRFEQGVGPALQSPAISFGDVSTVPAVWPEPERAEPHRSRRWVRTRALRMSRTGRLCRPSRHGRELCAIIREVVYQP